MQFSSSYQQGLAYRSYCTYAVAVLLVIILMVFSGCAREPEANRADERPNVIVIFADDMGYTDLSSYGASRWATPSLDRLGEEGARFTNFYVPTPACSPSRAALLTGRYPLKAGVREVISPRTLRGLPEAEETAAEIFLEVGYRTGMVGKWHLGANPVFLPTNHGFESWFGLPYSNDYSPRSINNPRSYAVMWPELPLFRDTTIVEREPDQRLLTERYTQEALGFIDTHKDEPFFLYLAHSMPHVPLWVSDPFLGESEGGLYGDVIEEVDASTGRILDRLAQLGLDEHTIVVFTSDNGPWLLMGDHGGTKGAFREGKATTFEGGVRMPALIRAPGQILAGQVIDEPAIVMDVLPTVLELAGIEGRDRFDGASLASALTGKSELDANRPLFFYRSGQLRSMRKGKWKLHVPHTYTSILEEYGGSPGEGGHPGAYGPAIIGIALYDLEADPSESVDVSQTYPDVVQELLTHIEDARSRIGDELTDRIGSEATPPQFIEAVWPTLEDGRN
ncbi:MAG: sulfatase [Bacteroidetes bacterium]|nr:sulfatase [Bacteroidota bacterium]